MTMCIDDKLVEFCSIVAVDDEMTLQDIDRSLQNTCTHMMLMRMLEIKTILIYNNKTEVCVQSMLYPVIMIREK